MPEPLIYIGYVVMVALIVLLSVKLGKYVDIIDAKSNISGAFIGGVMLAAVTSLPELFTSLSAVWLVHENALVIGNILGSDLINLAFFAAILLVFSRGLKKAKFSPFYYISIGVLVALYGAVAIGMYFAEYVQITWFSAVSPLILVLYVLFINKMPKTSDPSEDECKDNITLKQAVVRFIVCAVILIGASICMTYFSDLVSDRLGWGKTFAGALLLGVATSLPELISSATLCFRGNFDAAAGNILGSNIFNFMILFVADVFSFMPGSSGVYLLDNNSQWLLILGVAASFTTLCMLLVKNQVKNRNAALWGAQALNLLPLGAYVLYLLVSTGSLII